MLEFTPTSAIVAGIEIHWYGLIIAVGMALAVALACAREKRLGLPKDTALDLALAGIPGAIVCARLYYVLFSWQAYAAAPIRALYIWEGGLAIYGGIIGGVLVGFIYARRKKLPFLKLADLAAPSIALGQAVGRWGNFVNQEAFGDVAARQWQRVFPISVLIEADGQWHYATFFYESAWCLLIVLALLWAEKSAASGGRATCLRPMFSCTRWSAAWWRGCAPTACTWGRCGCPSCSAWSRCWPAPGSRCSAAPARRCREPAWPAARRWRRCC